VLKCEVLYETCPKIELTLLRVHPVKPQDSIQGHWAFSGALLLMAHPRSSYIVGDTLLKYLVKVQQHVPHHGCALLSSV